MPINHAFIMTFSDNFLWGMKLKNYLETVNLPFQNSQNFAYVGIAKIAQF